MHSPNDSVEMLMPVAGGQSAVQRGIRIPELASRLSATYRIQDKWRAELTWCLQWAFGLVARENAPDPSPWSSPYREKHRKLARIARQLQVEIASLQDEAVAVLTYYFVEETGDELKKVTLVEARGRRSAAFCGINCQPRKNRHRPG